MTTNPELTESVLLKAQSVLDAVVAAFAQQEVELPDRRFIHVGQAAHDQEQVVVSFEQMYIGTPGDQAQVPQKCDAQWTAVFSVQITRCVPGLGRAGAAPTVEDLTENAKKMMRDAAILFDAGLHAVDDWSGILADISVTDPQGKMQSVVMNLICGL